MNWLWRQGPLAGVLAVSIFLGVAVALATSGPSTSALFAGQARSRGSLHATPPVTPTPAPTPTPSVSRSGQLTGRIAVVVAGDRAVLSGDDRVMLLDAASASQVSPPVASQGLAVAPRNLQRVIAGGPTVRYSDDGGKTWKSPRTVAPGTGPYVALLVDPDDPDVWFFRHGARLLRTRDAGASWRELTGLPDLSSPVMLAGVKTDEELLLDGTNVALLDDNGNQVSVRGALPAAARSAAVLGGAVLVSAVDGKVYSSSGAGGGWTVVTAPVTGPLAGAGNHAWVADGAGVLGVAGRISSTADGSAWTEASGLPSDQSVMGLGADRAGSTVLAYCAGGDVYRSTDSGATFTLFSSALRS